MSIVDDMKAMTEGSVEEHQKPVSEVASKKNFNSGPQNDRGGSIYEPLNIDKESLPKPLNYYTVGGWFKPGSADSAEVCKKMAMLLRNNGYTLKVSMAELTNPILESIMLIKPTVSVIRPFPSYEPKDREIPEAMVSQEKISDDIYKVCAAYDPTFNSAGRGMQVFTAARVAAMLGGKVDAPVKYLVLYSWDRETSVADITSKTNRAVAVSLRIADAAGIKVVNMNNKDSLLAFINEIKEAHRSDNADLSF